MNTLPLTVRPMDDNDRAAMAILHARAVLAAYPAVYGEQVANDWAASRNPERYLKAQAAGESFLVGALGDKVIGFISWGFKPGELSAMYVDPDHHGQGVGKQLFAEAITHSQTNGAPITWVKAALPARGFYEKLGFVFKEMGTSTVQGHVIDDVLMVYPS